MIGSKNGNLGQNKYNKLFFPIFQQQKLNNDVKKKQQQK